MTVGRVEEKSVRELGFIRSNFHFYDNRLVISEQKILSLRCVGSGLGDGLGGEGLTFGSPPFNWRFMAQHFIDIQHAAKLARLQLSPAEVSEYQGQLGKIIDYMDTLEAYDLGEVEPMAHAMPVFDVWREDKERGGFTADEALSNAPRKAAGQFLVNRSVEDA